MIAAIEGHSRIAMILLNKRANISMRMRRVVVCSPHVVWVAVTNLLVKAGVDLQPAVSNGYTPLRLVGGLWK